MPLCPLHPHLPARTAEAMESFVSSVIAAGFGANDEAVAAEILQRLMGERPVAAAALLGAGGDVARLASLAALSDSLDYVADVILRCTGAGGGGQAAPASGGSSPAGVLGRRADRRSSESSGGGGSGAATPLAAEASQQAAAAAAAGSGADAAGATWQQQLGSRFKTWRRSAAGEGALSEGLAHLADRYRALAGQCARALRLDLLLLVLHHLQQLPRSSYVCQSEEEAREVDECVAALARCAPGGAGCSAAGGCGPVTPRAVAFKPVAFKPVAFKRGSQGAGPTPSLHSLPNPLAGWWGGWTRGWSRTCRRTNAPTPLPPWRPPPPAWRSGCCPTSQRSWVQGRCAREDGM